MHTLLGKNQLYEKLKRIQVAAYVIFFSISLLQILKVTWDRQFKKKKKKSNRFIWKEIKRRRQQLWFSSLFRKRACFQVKYKLSCLVYKHLCENWPLSFEQYYDVIFTCPGLEWSWPWSTIGQLDTTLPLPSKKNRDSHCAFTQHPFLFVYSFCIGRFFLNKLVTWTIRKTTLLNFRREFAHY